MRSFTTPQKTLLRSPNIKARLLVTFFLDEGTYRFCDDVIDYSDGVNTYIGASALSDTFEVRSGSSLSAEPITIIVDGNRMAQYGITDPARVLRDMLAYLHTQRRVNCAIGFAYASENVINLSIPLAAMKINAFRLIDTKFGEESIGGNGTEATSKLEITLDSLASRYNRAAFRMRSNDDQLEIDPTDKFFSYVSDAIASEGKLYWGKASPFGPGFTNGGVGGGRPFGYNGNVRLV